MASTIIQRILPGNNEVDQRISLAGNSIARPHGFGTAWKGLRLVVRYSIASAANQTITGSPRFAMGFCSGNGTNTLLTDSSVKNFVGIYSTATAYTFTTNLNGNGMTPGYFTTYSLGKKVGTTFTTLVATANTALISASAASRTRTFVVFDLIKGSPNYTVASYWQFMNDNTNGNPAGNGFADPSTLDLINAIEQPTQTFHSFYYFPQTSSIAVDEVANGVLDNITISWTDTVNPYEISDIYVGRLA